MWWHRTLTRGKAWWRRFSTRPGIAHLLRAASRFSDRQGNQFAAAITYFSFLSLVPILMVSFSVAGFVLAQRPDLLDGLKEEITAIIPGDFSDKIGGVIDQAVNQRFATGIIGLLVALYSGLNWMGNVRDAVRAQWRPQWDRSKQPKENFLMAYVWDLLSLAGLAISVLITFTLTAVGTAMQDLVVGWLGVDDVDWLRPVLRVGPFVVAILADVLIFAWIYTILPVKGNRADRRTLLIGSLTMAIIFEILKSALTFLVAGTSPAAKAFGAVIGLLLFFNLVARAFLMVAAWIATGVEEPVAGTSRAGADQNAGNGQNVDVPDAQPVTAVVLRHPSAGRWARIGFAAGTLAGWFVGRRRRR